MKNENANSDIIALIVVIVLFSLFLYWIFNIDIVRFPFIVALVILIFIGMIFYLIASILSYYFPQSKIAKFFEKVSDLIAYR